jgi:hypothetical protein
MSNRNSPLHVGVGERERDKVCLRVNGPHAYNCPAIREAQATLDAAWRGSPLAFMACTCE